MKANAMKVTEAIQAVKIPFKIPISPDKQIDRVVYAYLVFGRTITLIDSGVAGAEATIFNIIEENGRQVDEVATLILSHSHPDHIGSALPIQERTRCRVLCPAAERGWVEDTGLQAQERPVPGFNTLVAGSVAVDEVIKGGDRLQLYSGCVCQVIHTPGHSPGSSSLWFEEEGVLFSGDALPLPNDLPVYDDFATCVDSVRRLQRLEGIDILLSSWEAPILGEAAVRRRMRAGLVYLQKIHRAVLNTHAKGGQTGMDLCKQVIRLLGLPPSVANPLLAKAFDSSLAAGQDVDLS